MRERTVKELGAVLSGEQIESVQGDSGEYETPVRVAEADAVRITCTSNKGTGGSQKYTTWGEGADDETCLSSLTVSGR